MVAVLAFAAMLFLAVLVSDLAQRSVLSTAPLFLLSGFLVGDGILGWVQLRPESPVVARFAELALFRVLFTDGMRVGIRDLTSAWSLPGRALFLGLPLTLAGTALLAHVLVGSPWAQALLLGAALSPTDPVFAAAIVGREEVPVRLRNLLNVESGLNDGLALPVVVLMLAVLGGVDLSITIILELVLGVSLGMVIPWAAARLEQARFLAISSSYEPLYTFSVGLLVLSAASLAHANEFLAAFAAGVTIATVSPPLREAFHAFGDLIAELLKLSGLLVFGALISPRLLSEIPPSGYLFADLALLLVRPCALWVALAGGRLNWKEWVAAAWGDENC